MSAQVIIFVLVGGLGTLLGPILGAVLIQWLTIEAGAQSVIDSNLGLGAILVTFVLLIPQGLVPVARNLVLRLGAALSGRRMRAKPLGPAPGAALAGEVRR
jgi:branched-chain amino acid transport system permease protein